VSRIHGFLSLVFAADGVGFVFCFAHGPVVRGVVVRVLVSGENVVSELGFVVGQPDENGRSGRAVMYPSRANTGPRTGDGFFGGPMVIVEWIFLGVVWFRLER
jgi:hypothetical protein